MTQPAWMPGDARLHAYETSVRRQLPPARAAQCQHLARTLAWRTLDHDLTAGWKGRLLEEVSTAIGRHLGRMPEDDLMALAFIVLMDAAKSAQEDLKAIMAGVKNINKHKDAVRELLLQMVDRAEGRALRWPPL